VAFELALNNRVEDLLRREADVAVRMTPPTQKALVSRHLGRLALGLYGHRRYLERAGTPARLEDIEAHGLIGFDRQRVSVDSLGAAAAVIRRERFTLRTDSDLAQLAAVRCGYGLGVMQLGVARRDPELVRVLARQVVFHLDVWLVMHEDLRGIARVRAVFEHLAVGLRAYIATSQ
jgi:DNA-binding transcriptional LysR family regulator